MIRYITTHAGLDLRIYLVVLNRIGFLVDYQCQPICPCCLNRSNLEAIQEAVESELSTHGGAIGPVRWISDSWPYAQDLSRYKMLKPGMYCHGCSFEIPAEVRAEVLRLGSHNLTWANL